MLFLLTRTGTSDASELLYITALIGGFLFHTFWEAKCQYTLPYFILLIPLAVIGTARFLQNPSRIWKNYKVRMLFAAAVMMITLVVWKPYASVIQDTASQPASILAKTSQRMK